MFIQNSTNNNVSSTPIEDIFQVYVMSPLYAIGLLEKILSLYLILIILKRNENYGNIFYYMLTYELTDLLSALIGTLECVIKCGSLCSFGFTFFIKLAEIIISSYLKNSLKIFQILLEISFAINRIKSFKIQIEKPKKFKRNKASLFIIALLVASPNYLASKKVQSVGYSYQTNDSIYLVGIQPFAVSKIASYILSASSILTGLGMYLVLLVLTVLAGYKFKEFIKIKDKQIRQANISIIRSINSGLEERINLSKIRNVKAKEIKTTKILFALSLNTLIGNLPSSLVPILDLFLCKKSLVLYYYNLVSAFICVISHLSTILFFSINSNVYKKALFNLILNKSNK